MKLYAVVFTESKFPDVLQFCNVESGEDYLECSGTNITDDLNFAGLIAYQLNSIYTENKYKVVEIVVKELKD